MAFDFQPTLIGSLLTLRPLRREDQVGLRTAAADPMVWAGHPAKTRHLAEAFDPYFEVLLAGGGTLVVTETATGRIIGCSRYYVAPDMPDAVSIGFTFLTCDHWGGETNLELKRLMVGHVFDAGKEVWFHIAPSNIRSQKATAKLGARHAYDSWIDLGSGAADWMCFHLTAQDWQAAGH